ncbi:unnamed protein product [Periconia digitata]|uniref:Uncharacterized protein n=1 Tax=Periconia digitata TaxID=1303443 RepID=A0A9W4UDW5_9PLEO|nr:unnamed protein product [Periconia digitata]
MEEALSDVETRKDDDVASSWPSGDELDSHSLTAAFVNSHQNDFAPDPNTAESGILARLVRGCLDIFATLTKENDYLRSLQRRDQNIIKRSHDTLRLWTDSHGVREGKLDHALERSKTLRDTTLLTLSSLCGALLACSRKLGPRNASDTSTAIRDAQILYDQTRYVLASSDEDTSDSDVDSDSSSEDLNDDLRGHLVSEIKTYINCLVDLDTALECPAVDPGHVDEPVHPRLEERSAYEYYAELIQSKFPEVGSDLAECLGKANWDRYKRLKDIRERNESPQVVPFVSEVKSTASKSFKDSGLGTTAYAESVVSIISYVSSLSNGERVKIPPLPAEAKNGEKFECNACGDLIVATTNRAWRKHIFNDLQPYTCFYSDCGFSTVPFVDRRLWIDHLDIEHNFGPDWESKQCPLCLEPTGTGKSTNLVHFSRHMEEIALASLPRGVDSETNSEAGTSSVSDANSVPDVDITIFQDQTQSLFSSHSDDQDSKALKEVKISSYWSVREQEGFEELVALFGSDWDTIAGRLLTKTPIMVKNHYLRIAGSVKGAHLSRLAYEADMKREKREDIVQVPILNETFEQLQHSAQAQYETYGEEDRGLRDSLERRFAPLQADGAESAAYSGSSGSPAAVATEHDSPNSPIPNHSSLDPGNVVRTHPLYKSKPKKDGTYHCPFEGQSSCSHMPTALKSSFDKYVDSHLKPYRCVREDCADVVFSSTAELLRHEREAHGLHGHVLNPNLCYYPNCERSMAGKGYRRRYNLIHHMKRVHKYTEPSSSRHETSDTVSLRKSPPPHAIDPSTGASSAKHVIFSRPFTGDVRYESMKFFILPFYSTDSIISTVKHFYGIKDRAGVIFEDSNGAMVIPSYENLVHDMIVHVRFTGEARPETSSNARQSIPQKAYTPSKRSDRPRRANDTSSVGERRIPIGDWRTYEPPGTVYLQARSAYQSDDKTHLNFQKGAHIRVISQNESAWWYGAIDDRVGWFPPGYCVQADSPSQRRALACTTCAKAKTNCDKAVPSCSRCRAKGLVCEPRSARVTLQAVYDKPQEGSVGIAQQSVSDYAGAVEETAQSDEDVSSKLPRRNAERRPIACTTCAKAKTKCDKARPSCSRCTAKGLICEPRSTRRANDDSYRKPINKSVSPKRYPANYHESNWQDTGQMPPDFVDIAGFEEQISLLREQNRKRLLKAREEANRIRNSGDLPDTLSPPGSQSQEKLPPNSGHQKTISHPPDRLETTGELHDTGNTSQLTRLPARDLAQNDSLDVEQQEQDNVLRSRAQLDPPSQVSQEEQIPYSMSSEKKKSIDEDESPRDPQLEALLQQQQQFQQRVDELKMSLHKTFADDQIQIQQLLRERQRQNTTYPTLNKDNDSKNDSEQDRMQLMLLDEQNKKQLLEAPQKKDNDFKSETMQHHQKELMLLEKGLLDVQKSQNSGSNNGTLQDHQMQLMLLEQQNKRRLLEARQKQEVMASGRQAAPSDSPQPDAYVPDTSVLSPSNGVSEPQNTVPPPNDIVTLLLGDQYPPPSFQESPS